ncbi:proteasome-mediated ubiquitin-dependent protein catabolic process [Mactra antiquata]
MAGRHKEHLSSYLNKHKTGSASSSSGKGQATRPKKDQDADKQNNDSNESSASARDVPVFFTSKARMRASYMLCRKQHVVRITGSALINSLPDELLLKIFSYLDAGSLLMAARVCQRWLPIAKDKELWDKIYSNFFNSVPSASGTKSGKVENQNKKSMYIKSITNTRNKKAMRFLKKISPFTGMPHDTDKALKFTGVYYQLTFIDTDKTEHILNSNDIFYHAMSMSVRWYNLDMPSIKSLREIKVHAVNPLFFDEKGKALWNSPYQRSILLNYDINWSKVIQTSKPTGCDDMILLYTLPDGLVIATWQRGGEMAFVTVGLHYNQIVNRCLMGTSDTPFDLGIHKVIPDDVDPSYGLHDYQCTVEFRTLRNTLWKQQFQRLHCKKEHIASGYAVYPLIEEEYTHVTFDKHLQFPWKTDAFKGIVENVVWVDVTVMDERQEPYWCVSCCTNVGDKNFKKDFDFEFGNDGAYNMSYTDNRGKIESEMRKGDDKQYIMTKLTLKISLDAINSWFGTSYT